MRPLLVALLALAVGLAIGGTAQAQQQRSLESRIDAQTLRSLRPVLEAARRDSVPVAALENKALEGAAKGLPGTRIVAAVQQLATGLREARSVLRSAAPTVHLADGEIVATAEALRRGTPAAVIGKLRQNSPPDAMLEVPIAILGELVHRGVPPTDAEDVIEHTLTSGVPFERLLEIPALVDAALRVGAPPLEALGSALSGLGIPQPPGPSGARPPRRPPP